jgi:hypothetical protein
VSGGFDIAAYQLELEQAAFDSARSRLDSRGWILTMGAPGHYRATRLVDGRLHEIMQPTLQRLEIACQEYDEAVRVRAEAEEAEKREQKRLAVQQELDESLARKVRADEWVAREVEAKRRRLEDLV